MPCPKSRPARLQLENLEDRTLLSASLVAPITGGQYTPLYNLLFFVASDGSHGTELWRSDGSAAGTFMVKDINPGSAESRPSNLTNFNGSLYFTASDGTHGFELWKTNGGAGSADLVADLAASDLANVNGTLFFVADESTNGHANTAPLWRSDGTAAGTVLVQSGAPNGTALNASHLTNVSGALFFIGSDGLNRSGPPSPTSTARFTSGRTTARTGQSFGKATAPQPGPGWWRTSIRSPRPGRP